MTDETDVTLSINGQNVTVKKGTTVYEAAKTINVDIPIFCYQDRMAPFGACRMCLVEVEKMPKLQTSCTLIATEGMVVKTETAKAVDGRKGILELLLTNHPLDCPICDKGGECPLQENAMAAGPGKSDFYEEKRHFKKPLPMGPVLMLDRERCIICARCTRFGSDIAGDHALEFIERGYKTEVGTIDDKPVESKFIGNTIQICPVGALTSQVYRFRARPWDNASVNSSCTLCPVGCSMIFDSRDGEIVRTRSLEDSQVNDIWLCDKGFFGYQFVNDPTRLKTPLIRRNGKLVEASYDEAFSLIASKLKEAKESKKIAAFGGNPLTTEENYLFQKLMRDGLGVNNNDHRIGCNLTSLESEILAPGLEISIGETEELSYVFLLGCDLTEEFPVIWLRLRQAINKGAKVIYAGHYMTEIATYFTENIIHQPNHELEALKDQLNKIPELATSGKKGAIFVGSQYLNSKNRSSILAELVKVKESHANLSLNILEGSGNSMGARLAGMRPDLGSLGSTIETKGLNALEVLEESEKNGWDFLYVAGSNPALKFSKKLFDNARANLKFLVVQDIFLTETALCADVVLPTLCYIEKGGSFINIEGRVQKLQPGSIVPDDIYSDGEIFVKVAEKLNFKLEVDPEFIDAMNKTRIRIETAPHAQITNDVPQLTNGSYAATFSKKLFDQGVRMQHNEHLAKLSKTPTFRLNKNEGLKLGIKDSDIIAITANGNSIKGVAELDVGVADGTIVLPLGFRQVPVHDLQNQLYNGLIVKVTKDV